MIHVMMKESLQDNRQHYAIFPHIINLKTFTIMNQISLKHFLLLFLSVTLISCTGEDESDANNPDNTIDEDTPIGLTIGNDFYPLQNGEIEDYGLWYDEEECTQFTIYNLDIELYQQGITIDENGSRSGSGKGIYFELISDNNRLANGNYADALTLINSTFNRNFSSWTDLYSADDSEVDEEACLDLDGYIVYREISDYVNGENVSEDEAPIFSGGQLSFERNTSNGEITIIFTGATTDETRLPVSVYYKGFLTYLDNTDKRSINLVRRKKK